jgi:hypothetical protein
MERREAPRKEIMLADPQTIMVNAIAKNLARINQDNNGAVYRLRSSTDELVLTIKHSDGKISGGQFGEGHVVKVEYTVFATSTVPQLRLATWLVIQNPDGMDLTVVKNHVLALCAFATSANIDKFLNGES